jgi:serine/threonine protein kinase
LTVVAPPAISPFVGLLMGHAFDDHVVDEFLGQGGFGVVFGATATSGQRRAVKILTKNDADAVSEFRNEGVLLQGLAGCEGVVDLVGTGQIRIELFTATGFPVPQEFDYLLLARAETSLDALLGSVQARAAMSWEEKLRLWRSAVKGLAQMHNAGVAHRDLKASNCLVVNARGSRSIVFGDLGRSRDLTAAAAHEYVMGRGDMRFAGPEALFAQGGTNRADFLAADYHGLGSLLVEIITGQSMTGLAISNIDAAMRQGVADYRRGLRRDLRSLEPIYRTAIAGIIKNLPVGIREDAKGVLGSLCHPDPGQRLGPSPYSRDRASREPLAWILRRADIMIQRVRIDQKSSRNRLNGSI